MATNVTTSQEPKIPFDMAYGQNIVTLEGITPSQSKYALRIYVLGNTEPIADIRQTPNRYNRAIFDIQTILQTQVQPTINNIDGLYYSAGFAQQNQRMQIANGELVQYQIAYTTETNGEPDDPFFQDPTIYTTLGGSKEYWQVPYEEGDDYIPTLAGTAGSGCTQIITPARPLSDNVWTISDTETGDNLLTDNGGYSSPGGIDVQNVYLNDQCTKSFWQTVNRQGTPAVPNSNVRGIEGFWVLQYAKNGTLLSTNWLSNVQANGGGPNITLGQGQIPSGNFNVITVATGPANFPIGQLLSTTDHYYIIPAAWGCVVDPQGQIDAMQDAAWRIQRYNVINEPCNDYDHIQFAWLNSEGFRDQFTFTKKNEKKINTKRNNYLKDVGDFNQITYDVNKQSRGFTTYSQQIREVWSAMSGYMNDKEAELLESMFKSPSVMVRFSAGEYANTWIPINVISSSYTQKTYRKDRLFQYTVDYKLASNIKSQRG